MSGLRTVKALFFLRSIVWLVSVLCTRHVPLTRLLYSQGRLSPSSWSSGSWSSGSVLSGSRNSSKGSSRVSSQVSSPSASSPGYQDAWETLYAAAGEVVRLNMNEERKVAVHPTERRTPSKVINSNLRSQVSKEARPSGQMAGRRSPHATRRKDENLIYMTQVLEAFSLAESASNVFFDIDG